MKRSDEQIKKDIVDELYWDDRLDASKITVSVENGFVKLSGEVPSYNNLVAARSAAWRMAGVIDVVDDLKIKYVTPPVLPTDEEIQRRADQIVIWDPDLGNAVKSIRVVLQAPGARLHEQEREHLASQLPEEIAYYLKQVDTYEKYDLQEFYTVVAKGEGADYPDAVHHAKAVATTVQDAVTAGETRHISEQLPPDYAELFERQYEQA